MEPNGGRIEKFNQLVRALVVLLLTGGVVYGFIISKVVSTESFMILAAMAFTWWFKSRDEKNAGEKPSATPSPAPPSSP